MKHVLFEKRGWRVVLSNVQLLTRTMQLDPDIRSSSDHNGNYYALYKRHGGVWREKSRSGELGTISKAAQNTEGVDPSVIQSLRLLPESPTAMQERIAERASDVVVQFKGR